MSPSEGKSLKIDTVIWFEIDRLNAIKNHEILCKF